VIVDTSALIAILRAEEDAERYARALADADECRISAASYLETAIVIDAVRDPIVSRKFDDLVAAADLIIDPVTGDHAKIARAAYRDYGKGSGHPARLNFGDCLAYALARSRSEPLLFKGDDFGHTDIASVLG
jgi:ribonuclease VapC